MLDLIEKIGAGVCGLLVVLGGILYFCFTVPSTTPVPFVPKVREEAPPPPVETPASETPAAIPAADKAIIDKLAEQGIKVPSNQPLATKRLTVPKQLFEHVSAEANLIPELKKAKHTIIRTSKGDTRLKIFDIEPNSILTNLGFQENDTVELIDGEILEFNEESSTQYLRKYHEAMQKLRSGEAISVTVTRNHRPVQLQFKL
jgi:hypothetical protein